MISDVDVASLPLNVTVQRIIFLLNQLGDLITTECAAFRRATQEHRSGALPFLITRKSDTYIVLANRIALRPRPHRRGRPQKPATSTNGSSGTRADYGQAIDA